MNTIAFQNDSSGFVSLLSYMSIVYAYFFDQFMFHEALNGIQLVAALVILTLAVSIGVYKLRIKKAQEISEKEAKDY